jgi:V8-like Glu-specific endopeptidase
MWTFDFPPTAYFNETYGFNPSDEWLNHVRQSALRFATYCSASFVSSDGLVMTNHHCARESVTKVSKTGEDLHTNGFFAKTAQDERKVAGLFVDQLVVIKDVTAEIQAAMDKGQTEAEKIKNRTNAKEAMVKKFKADTGLEGQVVTFYNGGKYSLYGYKRYKDVRLVFAPETEMGFFGGDPDNFTYPRYDFDCSFFRVYDDSGKALHTDNFFKWSESGPKPDEPVFVVGNPGTTNRLQTVAQLEYFRDMSFPITVEMLDGIVKAYSQLIDENPSLKDSLQDQLFGFSNSWKAYNGILGGLRDEVMMQRKRDFESQFKTKVWENPKLKDTYGNLWEKIENIRAEMKKYSKQNAALNMRPFFVSDYFTIAKNLVKYANEMNLPIAQRDDDYKDSLLAKTTEGIIPDDFIAEKANKLLVLNIDMYKQLLGNDNSVVLNLHGDLNSKDAAALCLKNSRLATKEGIAALIKEGPEAILKSKDPFIQHVLSTSGKAKEVAATMMDLANKEADYSQMLGRALFEVYGTKIPPDATFTLRIADGVVKGYEYNGTTAPVFTTFYGLYDRYYSYGKQYPWNLPKRWQNPPAEFKLETPMDFICTADIIGGNSGSPIINRNAEIVGIAFDGNIESLPGQFIFRTEANRTVGVHSAGMYEAIKDLYNAGRLAEELKTGKIH